MPDEKPRLILHPGADLALGKPQSGRIVTEMVGDALALSRAIVNASESLAPRYKIGEHVFCEPDYRQILIWSRALELEPSKVVERLLQDPLSAEERLLRAIFGDGWGTRLVNGQIHDLLWDTALWSLEKFEWSAQLSIARLYISNSSADRGINRKMRSLEVPLKDLVILWCANIGLSEIDLSGAGKLEELECRGNHLTALDLSAVPLLTSLSCSGNQLSSLELSTVPQLKYLCCKCEALSVLDIRPLKELEKLVYDKNKTRLIQRLDQNF
jgi:hypothetical protein